MRDKELAKRIKELRNRKGFSQEELSEKSGLSLRTIQRIENGETEPRGDSLKRLAIALQVSPDEILDWQFIEDKNVLIMLNLSQLGFLAFPLLGIIIPLAIWILKKDLIKDVDKQGKLIINFQITWAIMIFPLFILGWLLLGPLGILLIVLLYSYNFALVLSNTKKVYKGKDIFYKPSFSFLI
jgi:transcriptional regulator with XRE-family HTH domain